MKKLVSLLLIIGIMVSYSVVVVSAGTTNETSVEISNESIVDISEDETVVSSIDDVDVRKKDYIRVKSSENIVRYDSFTELGYVLSVSNVNEYDYFSVAYISTNAVTLSNYETDQIEYSQADALINIDYLINPEIVYNEKQLDFYSIQFEEITIHIAVYDDENVVQTLTKTITILPTSHGVFAHIHNDELLYDRYISYMLDNGFFTNDEYRTASRSLLRSRFTYSSDEMEEGALNTSIEKSQIVNPNKEKTLKYYDRSTGRVTATEVQGSLNQFLANNVLNSTETTQTNQSNNWTAPTVTVTVAINALDSGNSLQVYGYVRWTDISGNTHQARNVQVEIMDDDVSFDDVKATVYTNNYGYYTATFSNDTIENGCDIFIRVSTINSDVSVCNETFGSLFSEAYKAETRIAYGDVMTSKASISLPPFDGVFAEALYVHQAFVKGYQYYKAMNNNDTHVVSAIYPTSKDTSCSSVTSSRIDILEEDYCDWDVVIHELGHQVSQYINVDSDFADDHSSDENLIARYGIYFGTNGAWSEGWASYFSMAAQNYSPIPSQIYGVADNRYSDIKIDDDSESRRNYLTETGKGEGNEFAVTAVLLNLIINSDINLSDQFVWNVAKNSECSNFSEFMSALYSQTDIELHSKIGIILETHNVSATPVMELSRPSVYTEDPDIGGTFYWNDPDIHAQEDDLYKHRDVVSIQFFDENYNFILQTNWSSGNVICVVSDDWQEICDSVDNAVFYWRVATAKHLSISTGPYYSRMVKALLEEKVIDISGNEQGNVCNISNGIEKWYSYVIPFSGYYRVFSLGDIDVVGKVYRQANFNDDFDKHVKFIDDDGGEGFNFLIDKQFNSGTKIYICIKGYDELEEGSCILNIVGSTNIDKCQNNYQMYIAEGEYAIFRFEAKSAGVYSIYTSGNTDTYIDLFEDIVLDRDETDGFMSDDDSGSSTNAAIALSMTAGQVVYIRVRGYSYWTSGNTNVIVMTPTRITAVNEWLMNQELYYGSELWYSFTAATSGTYSFYTYGPLDTYGDLFADFGPMSEENTPIVSNDDGDDKYNTAINCCLSYEMNAGQTVYIRITFGSMSTGGTFNLIAVKEN